MTAARSGVRRAALVAATVLVALAAATHALGLVALEQHVGFFAPVWDPDGRRVYLLERATRGVVWGAGWEHFTPPANAWVLSDRLLLKRLDTATGSSEVLERFEGSPVQGRVTKHYRGSIFNSLSARIDPGDDGVEFRVRMNVPRVPTSEQWSLRGTWTSGRPSGARWASEWAGGMATPDAVLENGVELITVKGREFFPAAVLAVEAGGRYRVLLKNDAFDELYPDRVPAKQIAERSGRERIARGRELDRVRSELVQRYRSRGLREGEAMLRAHSDMEDMGLIAKSPRLVATAAGEPPADLRVFDIPAEYFRVGLFQDIAAAIAAPGQEVDTSTGTYLKYYDDELGLRLKAWREAGNDRFAVRTGEKLYALEVRRFDR
jgi:hypothetical protein